MKMTVLVYSQPNQNHCRPIITMSVA